MEFKEVPIFVDRAREIKEGIDLEELIVDRYVTSHLVEKEYSKITLEKKFTKKMVPDLFHAVYRSLVTENIWDILSFTNNGVIDFKRMKLLTIQKVKDIKKELFA